MCFCFVIKLYKKRKKYTKLYQIWENYRRIKYLIIIVFLTPIYFCIPEIFKTNGSTRFLKTKSPFEFVFSRCAFTKVISSQKAVQIVGIKAFLVYKLNYNSNSKWKKNKYLIRKYLTFCLDNIFFGTYKMYNRHKHIRCTYVTLLGVFFVSLQ